MDLPDLPAGFWWGFADSRTRSPRPQSARHILDVRGQITFSGSPLLCSGAPGKVGHAPGKLCMSCAAKLAELTDVRLAPAENR